MPDVNITTDHIIKLAPSGKVVASKLLIELSAQPLVRISQITPLPRKMHSLDEAKNLSNRGSKHALCVGY
jgi:hypothetical protein